MDTQNRKDEPVRIQACAGTLSPDSLENARSILETYSAGGVILEGTMDGPSFLTSDELSHVRLAFHSIDPDAYRKNWESFFQLSYEDYLLYIRCSVLFLLGKRILGTLRNVVLDMKTLTGLPLHGVSAYLMNNRFNHPRLVTSILLSLPVPDENVTGRDNLAELIESTCIPHPGNQRGLPDFKSILTFGALLDDFWQDAVPDEKLLYFPVLLWWKITGVIPTRPREFLVTPRDCIHCDAGGEWQLTLRKDLLKGRTRFIYYKISQDYEEKTYPVPAWLASLVQEYIALTAGYAPTELDTLLIPDPHYLLKGRSRNKRSRYFTYANLRCILQDFLDRIVHGRYGYTVLDPEPDGEAGEEGPEGPLPGQGQDSSTSFLYAPHLGDTRHISLINMIAEGVQPLAAMELAAHENPRQVFHYAANLDTYLKCATYQAYRDRDYAHSPFSFNAAAGMIQINESGPRTELDEGFCYSPLFGHDDVSDCLKAFGPHSELGWCQRCPYYRSKTPGMLVMDTSRYLLDVQEDWALLTTTIDNYRRDVLGKDEELFQVLLRVQSSLNVFQNVLRREMKNGGAPHGKNKDLPG